MLQIDKSDNNSYHMFMEFARKLIFYIWSQICVPNIYGG